MFDGAAAGDPIPIGIVLGIGGLLIGSGLLVLEIARRSARGTLPRNRLAGIRTTATLASDQAWDVAHRAAAPSLRRAAWGSIIAGLALQIRPSNALGLVIITGGMVWLLGWVLRGGWLGNREARRRP